MKCLLLVGLLFFESSAIAKVGSCNNADTFDKVFGIYESNIETYFRKFAEALSKHPHRESEQKRIKASILMYRTKLQILKRNCLEVILKDDRKLPEAELIASIKTLLDLTFEYEFPGLDFEYYNMVHRGLNKNY